VRWILCDHWCDTCKQPLVDSDHARDHREFKGHHGVRRLPFDEKVRIQTKHVCACAYRSTSSEEFSAHVRRCDCAFQKRLRLLGGNVPSMSVRSAVRPVVRRVVDLYDSVGRECCNCGAMEMVERSHSDLSRRLVCQRCLCEVSELSVS
jgi:hypothetical protein